MTKQKIAAAAMALIMFGISVCPARPLLVYADGGDMQNDNEVVVVTTADELNDALYYGGNYKLGADINTSESQYGSSAWAMKDTVLDLDDYTITLSEDNASIYSWGAELTIKGNQGGIVKTTQSSEYPAVWIYDGSVVLDGGIIEGGKYPVMVSDGKQFTMNGGVINGDQFGIVAYGASETTINGGTINSNHIAVSGWGSNSGTRFTINGGVINGSLGVYLPHPDGSTTVTGGTINATTAGIEIRAGSLNITGGTISVPADTEYSVLANGSGSTTAGAAVAVAQHTTKQPINVTISGGVFTAPVAFAESNPQGNDIDDIKKVSLSISGGTFNTTGDFVVISNDVDGFVTGGAYNKNLDTKYVAGGYVSALDFRDNAYKVVSLEQIESKDEVVGTYIDEKGEEINYIAPKQIDYGDGYIEDGGEGEGHVSATIEFGKKLIADKKATLSVVEKSVGDLTIDGAKGGDLIGAVEIDMLDRYGQKIEVKDNALKIRFDIDDETYAKLAEYDDLYAVYFEDGKEVERYKITLEGEAGNYSFWFETAHLSTYAVVGVNEVVASAPETGMSTTTGASVTTTSSVVMAAVIGVLTSVISFVYLVRRKQ